jgi:predicted GNAT family acetyltransferase
VSAEPQVVDNPQLHRFEVRVDGELAGFTDYHDRGNRRAFTHTETEAGYEGHGLASKLVATLLDDARAKGLEVLPYCPFVRHYIEEHRDYVNLVPADERAGFGLG